nr:hydroxyphenylacetyl-CoA thioesterase PaaI [Homoserinimonas sp. OAct 916]
MFENDRASAALGMHVITLTPGHAVITMRVRNDMLNGFAIAHGGFIFALADTAFAAACNEDERVTVASGAEISYLRPAREGQLLTATAHRRHLSGRNGIYDVQVTNEDEVIAEFRGRSRITSMSAPTAVSPEEKVSPQEEVSPKEEVSPPDEGA